MVTLVLHRVQPSCPPDWNEADRGTIGVWADRDRLGPFCEVMLPEKHAEVSTRGRRRTPIESVDELADRRTTGGLQIHCQWLLVGRTFVEFRISSLLVAFHPDEAKSPTGNDAIDFDCVIGDCGLEEEFFEWHRLDRSMLLSNRLWNPLVQDCGNGLTNLANLIAFDLSDWIGTFVCLAVNRGILRGI